MSITAEVTAAVAGFGDGTIRIFDLNDRKECAIGKTRPWFVLPKALSGTRQMDGNNQTVSMTIIIIDIIVWYQVVLLILSTQRLISEARLSKEVFM